VRTTVMHLSPLPSPTTHPLHCTPYCEIPMSRAQLLIDTDPGVDDALAILMAHADADIAGLSIAAGNVGLAHTVRNACTLVDLLGVATPVFAGCATPLVRAPAEDAAF